MFVCLFFFKFKFKWPKYRLTIRNSKRVCVSSIFRFNIFSFVWNKREIINSTNASPWSSKIGRQIVFLQSSMLDFFCDAISQFNSPIGLYISNMQLYWPMIIYLLTIDGGHPLVSSISSVNAVCFVYFVCVCVCIYHLWLKFFLFIIVHFKHWK